VAFHVRQKIDGGLRRILEGRAKPMQRGDNFAFAVVQKAENERVGMRGFNVKSSNPLSGNCRRWLHRGSLRSVSCEITQKTKPSSKQRQGRR
jgi:hypothetical protein